MANISYCFIVLSVFIVCTFGGGNDDNTLQEGDIAIFEWSNECGLLMFVAKDGEIPYYKNPKKLNPEHQIRDVLFLLKPNKPGGEESDAYKYVRKQIQDTKAYDNVYTALFAFGVAYLSFGTLELLDEKGGSSAGLLHSVQVSENLFGKDTAKDNRLNEPYHGPLPKDSLAIYKTNSHVRGLLMFVAKDGINPKGDQEPAFIIKPDTDESSAYVQVVNWLKTMKIYGGQKYGKKITFLVAELKFNYLLKLDL